MDNLLLIDKQIT